MGPLSHVIYYDTFKNIPEYLSKVLKDNSVGEKIDKMMIEIYERQERLYIKLKMIFYNYMFLIIVISVLVKYSNYHLRFL